MHRNRTLTAQALIFVSCILIAELPVALAIDKDTELKIVSHVDLARYSGRWFEIAKIPNRFQKKCARSTTADYALRDDGRINVTNRCIKKDGSVNEVSGVARIKDKQSNAKLQVSFVSLFGWRLFWGDYWVIGLDKNYRWAIVGHPQRKFGWILSRTPELDDATLEKIFGVLETNGYRRESFETSAP